MTVVVLACDAHSDAGLGHLSRSSALALALRREGASIRALGIGLEAPIERYGISWEPTREPDAAGADAIVIDSYRMTDERRAWLASVAPVVAFADDDRDLPDAALVIRSGSATGREHELAGAHHACLGPEFWSSSPRSLRADVQRVLVATGGNDRTGIGPSLAKGLRDALPSADVVLVRGPYASPVERPEGILVVSAPASLFDLLVEADIVVSAAGQTALEALAVGTPCIALVVADNQARQASELLSIDALTVGHSVEGALAAARSLAADFDARHRLARAGQDTVDGRGAMRVAGAVLAVASETACNH